MAQMEHSNDLAKVWIGEAAPQHRRPESMAGTGRALQSCLLKDAPFWMAEGSVSTKIDLRLGKPRPSQFFG